MLIITILSFNEHLKEGEKKTRCEKHLRDEKKVVSNLKLLKYSRGFSIIKTFREFSPDNTEKACPGVEIN